jgi:hypothetical protein
MNSVAAMLNPFEDDTDQAYWTAFIEPGPEMSFLPIIAGTSNPVLMEIGVSPSFSPFGSQLLLTLPNLLS